MDRGATARAAALGLVGALAGAAAGALLASMLSGGFVADWYVHAARDPVPRGDALVGAALLALLLASVLSPLGSLLEAWARARRAPLPAAPRTPGTHAVLAFAAHAGAATLLILGFTAANLGPLGGDADKLVPGWAALGGVAGALAAGTGAWWMGRAVAAGRVGSGGDNPLSGLMLGSARNPRTTLLAVLLVTLVMAGGVPRIDTDVNVADVLPRGDPNTDAAHNLTSRFKSAFTQQVTMMFRVNPEAWAEDNRRLPFRVTEGNPRNISDEVYVRAMDQALTFIVDRSPFVGSIANPDFYRLVNFTIAGGESAPPGAFSLPPTTPEGEARFAMVDRGVWIAVPGTADAVISPSFGQTSALLVVATTETMPSRAIGEAAIAARDAYVAWAEANPDVAYQVFTGAHRPLMTADIPVANAHSSELAQQDFARLIPVIAAWIAVCLFLAFRNVTAIAVAMGALLIGTVWTYGAMGYMGIPLNTLNLTLIPLIMGVGIDYSLHIINEFQEQRAVGKSKEDALRTVSRRAALALFVANLNTIAGLMVMVVSPSLLIAQLGLLSAIAIGASYLLMVTFMPAALGLLRREAMARRYRPSEVMARLARGVGRRRAAVLAVLLVGTLVASAAAQRVGLEAFGDPPRNWLPGDPYRAEHETGLQGFYDVEEPDVKANVLVFEGNVTTPQAHRYMDLLEASLRTKPLVVSDTLRTLPFLIRTYLTVRDGLPGAGGFLVQERLGELLRSNDTRPYPRSQAAIEAAIQDIFTSPLAHFGNLFVDYPRMGTAIMVFSVRADTFQDAEAVWAQVWEAVRENEAARPADVQVNFVGNTATNYLFIAKELPWLALMSLVTNVLVVLLVWLPTRDLRATAVVGVLNFVTSMWWLALLPELDIGLSIYLTIPLVFIYAIGSDYGLHLALSASASGDMEETFRTTGKAVLFSAIILVGAFAIFTGMSNLAVQRTMLATATAIAVMFLLTLLVVPAVYKVKPRDARGAPRAEPTLHAPAPSTHRAPPRPGARRRSPARAPPPPAPPPQEKA